MTTRRGNEMEYRLNIEAIKEQFAGAIVAGYGGKIHILLPTLIGPFLNIGTGELWTHNEIGECDWVIRQGDKCESGHGGKFVYSGFSGDINFPYATDSGDLLKSIRPHLTETQQRIFELQYELDELRSMEV